MEKNAGMFSSKTSWWHLGWHRGE